MNVELNELQYNSDLSSKFHAYSSTLFKTQPLPTTPSNTHRLITHPNNNNNNSGNELLQYTIHTAQSRVIIKNNASDEQKTNTGPNSAQSSQHTTTSPQSTIYDNNDMSYSIGLSRRKLRTQQYKLNELNHSTIDSDITKQFQSNIVKSDLNLQIKLERLRLQFDINDETIDYDTINTYNTISRYINKPSYTTKSTFGTTGRDLLQHNKNNTFINFTEQYNIIEPKVPINHSRSNNIHSTVHQSNTTRLIHHKINHAYDTILHSPTNDIDLVTLQKVLNYRIHNTHTTDIHYTPDHTYDRLFDYSQIKQQDAIQNHNNKQQFARASRYSEKPQSDPTPVVGQYNVNHNAVKQRNSCYVDYMKHGATRHQKADDHTIGNTPLTVIHSPIPDKPSAHIPSIDMNCGKKVQRKLTRIIDRVPVSYIKHTSTFKPTSESIKSTSTSANRFNDTNTVLSSHPSKPNNHIVQRNKQLSNTGNTFDQVIQRKLNKDQRANEVYERAQQQQIERQQRISSHIADTSTDAIERRCMQSWNILISSFARLQYIYKQYHYILTQYNLDYTTLLVCSVIRIQRVARSFLYKTQQRRKRKALLILRSNFRFFIIRWKLVRRNNNANILHRFFAQVLKGSALDIALQCTRQSNLLTSTTNNKSRTISMILKNYRSKVITIQRTWRHYLYIRELQICVLDSMWNKICQKYSSRRAMNQQMLRSDAIAHNTTLQHQLIDTYGIILREIRTSVHDVPVTQPFQRRNKLYADKCEIDQFIHIYKYKSDQFNYTLPQQLNKLLQQHGYTSTVNERRHFILLSLRQRHNKLLQLMKSYHTMFQRFKLQSITLVEQARNLMLSNDETELLLKKEFHLTCSVPFITSIYNERDMCALIIHAIQQKQALLKEQRANSANHKLHPNRINHSNSTKISPAGSVNNSPNRSIRRLVSIPHD